MTNYYHPTAIISNKAKIGDNVKIGAYSIIEDDVEIGDNTEIYSHSIIANGARIGSHCRIFYHTVISAEPQDLKYNNEPTLAIIGDRNCIREFTSIHRGTTTGKTVIGNDNLIMAYCHIAHDCRLGSNNIMSNTSQFAGHVHAGDWIVFGAFAKVHQFCSIGSHAMVGADIKCVKDIAPYTLIGKIPPKTEGINKIGLRRRGFAKELIDEIDYFYKCVLFSGLNTTDGIKKYLESNANVPDEIMNCINFINTSNKGIYR
jgi:UDP-N-acetylglucosamine acyltransferase